MKKLPFGLWAAIAIVTLTGCQVAGMCLDDKACAQYATNSQMGDGGDATTFSANGSCGSSAAAGDWRQGQNRLLFNGNCSFRGEINGCHLSGSFEKGQAVNGGERFRLELLSSTGSSQARVSEATRAKANARSRAISRAPS